MADIVIRLDFRMGTRWQRLGLAGLLLLFVAPELGSESVTLSTYYPAPSGVYTNMITTGNTFLARDTGSVAIGVPTALGKLHVENGNVLFTNANLGLGDPGMTIGAGMPAPGSGVYMLDLKWNSVIRIGDGMLSSGGNAVRLGNNEYHDGTGWRGKTAPTPGAMIEVLNQDVNFYAHNGAGTHSPMMSVTQSASDLNGHMIVRGEGSCNMTHVQQYAINGQTLCPLGTYATMQTGVISRYHMMARYADTTLSQSNAWMFCCPCPTTGCPSL